MAEQKFSPTEALAARGNVNEGTITAIGHNEARLFGSEIKRGQELGKLLKEKNEGKVGKDTFAEKIKMGLSGNKELSVYEKADIGEMRTQFGAGEVEIKKGKLKGPEDVVGITKEGRNQIDKITDFLDYSSVAIELNNGKELNDALKDKGIVDKLGNPADITWNNMRGRVLDDILHINGFTEELFPFLKGLAVEDQRDFVEQTMASDPALQKKIVDKMKILQGESKILPKVKEDKSNRATRIEKEGKLVDKLGSVMPDAIGEVLIERHAEMSEVEKKQRASETDERFKGLEKIIDTKYINYNYETRTRAVNTKDLGDDVRYLAYSGKDGIDRLLVRELQLAQADNDNNGQLVFKDDQGKVLADETGRALDWKEVNLSNFSSHDKELLNLAKEKKYDDKYQKKLLSDFGIARVTEKGLLGFGENYTNLKMKDFEWALLNQNLGDKLEATVGANPKTKGVLEELKKNGVDKQKDKKNWILALLFALGCRGCSEHTFVGRSRRTKRFWK